ncbi:hypothetical protein CR513_01711, partial [Mucuna pruriens]
MYISKGSDTLSCKMFPSTLRGVTMQWLSTLLARTIRSFKDLVILFVSQFVANKAKRLKVVDLFNIRQAKGEKLKSYLARFNNATVRVNDPNQKFFVKGFQKGLRVGQFSDALALRRSSKKHIEVKEDLADQLEAKHQPLVTQEMKQGFPRKQQADGHLGEDKMSDVNFTRLMNKDKGTPANQGGVEKEADEGQRRIGQEDIRRGER